MDEFFGMKFAGHTVCAVVEAAPKVERVEYRNRATIVFFADGTKSVSKCSECMARVGGEKPLCALGVRDPQNDSGCSALGYSKEKGLITALAKRHRPDFGDLLKKWC
ncbi:MAG: hypothetical protein RSG23_05020 [Gordonibacter sp.]|uniref:hypothetical protein n=1 Tax=Gordonibacter sp. TaxID=1968902 RepID=UPI002FCC32F3